MKSHLRHSVLVTDSPRPSLLRTTRAYARTFSILMAAKHWVWRNSQPPESYLYGFDGTTNLNLVTTFPLYAPLTSGSYEAKAESTIETINQIFSILNGFAETQTGKHINTIDIREFATSSTDLLAAEELKKYLDNRGSDKANPHNYHMLYGPLLKSRDQIRRLLEIGIGTSNVDVLSNMGPGGKPGASLRAFRDYLPNAEIYGADIDKRILFEEDRIKTHYLDQTDITSFDKLRTVVPPELDLIIDDGLHSPSANLNTVIFGLTQIKIGGWIVVEDIAPDAIPVWKLVSALLPANYPSHILTAAGFLRERNGEFALNDRAATLFAVQRLG
jgi:hypothetical protein